MRKLASVTLAATLALAALSPSAAQAQAYPSKPIRLVVPYAPGGATDIISRAVAIELSKTLGQAVNVDNRPGAGANLGSEMVARSAPDGYTLLTSASSLHGITPFLYKKLTYDPNKDLAPVIVLAGFANVLVLNPAVPANSVMEVIALAKAQPGKLTCASSGSGSTIHMSCEMFKHILGLDITHVPYKGSGPAVTDLMGGQVNMMFDNIPSSITHIRSGKLRALATTGMKRSPTLPDLPTILESGVPGYDAGLWYGFVGPARMPPEIVQRLNAEIVAILAQPDTREKLASQGLDARSSTPEEFARIIASDIVRWAAVVQKLGLQAE